VCYKVVVKRRRRRRRRRRRERERERVKESQLKACVGCLINKEDKTRREIHALDHFPATLVGPLAAGLQAVADVAAAIQAGYYDMGIAAGVETMTANPMKWEGGRVGTFHSRYFASQNTVQLLTAGMVHVCNQSDTREWRP
jgi:hypothetical protein